MIRESFKFLGKEFPLPDLKPTIPQQITGGIPLELYVDPNLEKGVLGLLNPSHHLRLRGEIPEDKKPSDYNTYYSMRPGEWLPLQPGSSDPIDDTREWSVQTRDMGSMLFEGMNETGTNILFLAQEKTQPQE